MSPPGVGPESEVPARHPEPAPTTTTTVDTAKSNGHGRLLAALKKAGGSLESLTVLDKKNDPYRVDTPAGHRDGQWLADRIAALNLVGPRHIRGLHYAFIGQTKPNGEPYTNTDKDWEWLATPAKCARWLGYVPFDAIVDQRNEAPVIKLWTPADPKPTVSVDFEVAIPDIDDLTPRIGVKGFIGDQPYRLVLIGEKSSLRPVLEPIAYRYQADLYLPTGEISDTQLYAMARRAAADGRDMVVFYFSDCDPSGWQMPVSVHHKLRAFKDLEFDDAFECQMRPVVLTPDQVRRYELPSTPLKDTEKRAGRWFDAMGVLQTEVDALAALRPDLLAELAETAIAPFYDATLARRVERARREWIARAQPLLDEHLGDHAGQIRADAAARLDEVRAEAERILDEIPFDTTGLELPEFDIPEAELGGTPPPPLCDSRWDFTEQCRLLKARKAYTNGDEIG
jgi:hypothetical protein